MRAVFLGLVGAMLGVVLMGVVTVGGVVLVTLGAGAAVFVLSGDPDMDGPMQPITALGPTEVVVTGVTATDVRLDGTSMEYVPGTGWTARVAPGNHTLRAHNMLGKEIASKQFTARRGHRSLLSYAKKKFTYQGTTPTRAPRGLPAPPSAVVEVANPAPVALSAPTGFSLGGLGLTGGTESTHTTTNRSSSEQYGQVTTSGPGRTETHGYRDAQSQEDRRSRRSVLGF